MDAGSMRHSMCFAGSCVPMTTIASMRITSSPSSPSTSDAARVVSADSPPIAMSSTTSTTVWIAIPPRMLPTAIPRVFATAAEAVMAISGRFVATASRITPPIASPSPSRVSSTSVEAREVNPGDPDGTGGGEKDEHERDEAQARKHARVLQEGPVAHEEMESAISCTKLSGASKGAAWPAPSIRCVRAWGIAAASDRTSWTMLSGLRAP